MSKTDRVFEIVAELKYQKLPALRPACKCELYQWLVSRIEDGCLMDRDLDDLVSEVSIDLLSGAGGDDWSRNEATTALRNVMDEVRDETARSR